MRGGSRRAADAISVSPLAFEWERCALATLRHTTLPWNDGFASELTVRAVPLASAGALGQRDRLSLLAQFAAHQGLLRFAGIVEGDFDPSEWAIAQKRGADCRLIRIAARAPSAEAAPPALTIAQQFADFVKAPQLAALRRSWARAEAVYVESLKRLREDAAADLTWARRAAVGSVLAPGSDALRDIIAWRDPRSTYDDPAVIEALESLAVLDPTQRVIVLRGRAIVRYGALEGLRALGIDDYERLSEAAIVERVAALLPSARVVFAVADLKSFDAGSARVVQLLGTVGDAAWVVPASGSPTLPRTRFYVAAATIAAAREFEQRVESTNDARAAVDEFLGGPAFDEFFDRGTVTIGDARLRAVEEPRRSYIAALALLGNSVPLGSARRLLAEFMYERPLDGLAIPDLTRIDDEAFLFASDAIRRGFASMIPQSSRTGICRVAAAIAAGANDPARAGALLLNAGDTREALAMLDRVSWPDDDAILAALDGVSRTALHSAPQLARAWARALVRAARYSDARDLSGALEEADRELLLASIERRTGDYAAALARLERLPHSCEGDLLRAEILAVQRREAEAATLLETCTPSTDDERVRRGYALALLGREADDWKRPPARSAGYYTARLTTYRALDEGNIEAALEAISDALAKAGCAVERIDVLLDRVFALFSAGRWADARRAALEGLSVVEETQGDRAAGGLLFVLAYLAADDGQWAHAAQRISRLRHFYGTARDERHLAEIDLLNAHLEFSRGHFDEGRRLAARLVAPEQDEPIRIAAALIVEEADSIAGRVPSVHIESSSNAEFSDRARLLAARRGTNAGAITNAFNAALAKWELEGGVPPAAQTGSEQLKLFRSFLAHSRKRGDASLRKLASEIARAMQVDFAETAVAAEGDVSARILRAVIVREYPFGPHDLECAWRYAVRNRLDQWTEIGSLSPLAPAQLDEIARSSAPDWMTCSDRELLYIEGMTQWSREARDAIGAAFRTRAELHRLRRLLDQDEPRPAQTTMLAGIVGDSPLIRGVIERASLVARRDVSVCILGESGTGKELVARAIHTGSPRRHKPFTPVNCGALPENLIESELFGHMRGAFTGADRDRAGLIEASDGGTLFLDEIGEMPLVAQAKLLRFLQEGEFRRLGDIANRSADVRIVTATNRKLDEAVESGRFREDLYYRVAGIEIVLPPLRERGNDVLALASHFLALERNQHRSGPARFSPDVESIFASYSWPGNVRELQNAIRGAHAVAGEAREIGVDHLPDRLRSVVAPRTPPGSYQDAVARFRRELIERALRQADGNQNRAATMLKMSRQALAYQIRELGILVGRAEKRSRAEQ